MYSLDDVLINFVLSVVTYFITFNLIPKFYDMFLNAKIFGLDLNKVSRDKMSQAQSAAFAVQAARLFNSLPDPTRDDKSLESFRVACHSFLMQRPEAMGVVCGCIYLIFMFLFIPVPFREFIVGNQDFPYTQFVETLSSLLSICCMLLLGFADDILDLKWRHKLLLPTVASLPLLMVYYVTFNLTTVVVPKPFQELIGVSVNLGILYYVYMGMLAVFCTNAINILAGVNGLEVGQSVVIAVAIAIFNVIEIFEGNTQTHIFSLLFILPYIAVSSALLRHNWYPAKTFVGDTFCYFSGMTFAVVGILGHFSKTMLLFFIPQVVNFVYSAPQLFRIIPCPRHRMPRLNPETGLLEMSTVPVAKSALLPGVLPVLRILSSLKLLALKEDPDSVVVNNLTAINLVLVWCGPLHEATLTSYLLAIQVLCSCVAFLIRYPLAYLFYDLAW